MYVCEISIYILLIKTRMYSCHGMHDARINAYNYILMRYI